MAGWGAPEPAPTGDEDSGSLPNGGEIDLGNGHVLKLNEEAFRALLHRPETEEAIVRRGQVLVDAANSLAAPSPHVSKLAEGEPLYTMSVQNDPDTTRARVRVRPTNIAGVVDDAVNSTLLKALDSVEAPSGYKDHYGDPIPEGGEHAEGAEE